jgi:addiction module HigA family antidote
MNYQRSWLISGTQSCRSGWWGGVLCEDKNMKKNKLHPVHPGEVLLEEFLKPMGLSQNKLAVSIGVPARRINGIVLEKRRISADTALRLGRFFGTSSEFWLGLQSQYDLDIAADALGDRLAKEVKEYSEVA